MAKTAPMAAWEYMTEAMGHDDLAARGQEGWELVAVQSGMMFYKRPYVAPPPDPVVPVPEPAAEEATTAPAA
jgi:hypothetical protein